MLRFGVGDCCCEESDPCVIQEDSFDRADGSLGASWDADDWDIDTNQAVTTASNALAIGQTAGADENGRVVVVFTAEDDGDEIDLILSYTDEDNYVFGRFKVEDDTEEWASVTLYERASGTSSQIGNVGYFKGFASGVTHEIGICRDYDTPNSRSELKAFRITDDSEHFLAFGEITETLTGTKAGFGSGSITAAIRLEEFTHAVVSGECEQCPGECYAEAMLEDFDNEVPKHWAKSSGANFSISGSSLRLALSGSDNGKLGGCLTAESVDGEFEFELQAALRIVSAPGTPWSAGIAISVSSLLTAPTFFAINDNGLSNLRWIYNNGTATSDIGDVTDKDEYELKIWVHGVDGVFDEIELYVDGALVHSDTADSGQPNAVNYFDVRAISGSAGAGVFEWDFVSIAFNYP